MFPRFSNILYYEYFVNLSRTISIMGSLKPTMKKVQCVIQILSKKKKKLLIKKE